MDIIQKFNSPISGRTTHIKTRSQAVASIADRTVSQHLRGHVTSSVTWPSDSPYAISYFFGGGTESLNPAVFEILRSKRIGVTSLTFQGHVMYVIVHVTIWYPIGHFLSVVLWNQASSLSLTVSEILIECSAMVDMTLIRPLIEGQGHSFWYHQFLNTTSYSCDHYSNFCSRMHRLAAIHSAQRDNDDDKRTQHCTDSATVSTVG